MTLRCLAIPWSSPLLSNRATTIYPPSQEKERAPRKEKCKLAHESLSGSHTGVAYAHLMRTLTTCKCMNNKSNITDMAISNKNFFSPESESKKDRVLIAT
jgi:ribosomal protein L20